MALGLSSSPSVVTTSEDAVAVVEELMAHIKAKFLPSCGLNVGEIVHIGSLATGTALPGRFDSSLVTYSPDIDAWEVIRNGYKPWLSKINELFKSDKDISEFYQFSIMNERALQFTLEGVEVELLVSPIWSRPGELYTFLESTKPQHRDKFMHCAAKWQAQFFKQQPTNQRNDFRWEFIRRAKAWREQKWPRCTGGAGRPSSYLLSLLVIKAYEIAQKRVGIFSMLSPESLAYHASEAIKSMVHNNQKLEAVPDVFIQIIYWERCYSLNQYPTLVTPRPPRILDPANPANNLYVSGVSSYGSYQHCGEYMVGDGDWSMLNRHIDSLDLSKPVNHWV